VAFTYEGQAVIVVRSERVDDGKTVVFVPTIAIDDGANAFRHVVWEGEPVTDGLEATRIASAHLADCLRALLRSHLVNVQTHADPGPVYVEGAPR